MCEPTSTAEVVRVDVARERGVSDAASPPPTTVANVEYWQSALQELCKNPPTQHAYVANPLAPPPQAYGLWSGQLPPPLLTPYAPLPFFGGFFPGAYPIPTPAAAVPTVSFPSVKPEVSEDGSKTSPSGDLQPRKRRKSPAATSGSGTPAAPILVSPQTPSSPSTLNRRDDTWVKLDDEVGTPVACDDREMKKERRKQSNRESARRSRLRKQRECEALQKQVRDMVADRQRLEREVIELKQRIVDLERENQCLKGNWTTR